MRAGDEGSRPDHERAYAPPSRPQAAFLRPVEPTGDRLGSTAEPAASTPGGPGNWGYQRVAHCGYGAVEVITRHALAATVGRAPCDRVAVQHNPRTGVDIQPYRASSGQPLCL